MNYHDFDSVGGCDDYIKEHVLIILRQIEVFPSGQVVHTRDQIEQPRREPDSLNVTKAYSLISHQGPSP